MLGISLWSAVNLMCPEVVTDWWLSFRQSLMVAWRCWGLKEGMCLSSTWAAGPASGRPSAGALLLVSRISTSWEGFALCWETNVPTGNSWDI